MRRIILKAPEILVHYSTIYSILHNVLVHALASTHVYFTNILCILSTELVCHRLEYPSGHRKHSRRELASGGRETNLALMRPEAQNNSDVLAQVGGTAVIRCYTLYLGDELVSLVSRVEIEHSYYCSAVCCMLTGQFGVKGL